MGRPPSSAALRPRSDGELALLRELESALQGTTAAALLARLKASPRWREDWLLHLPPLRGRIAPEALAVIVTDLCVGLWIDFEAVPRYYTGHGSKAEVDARIQQARDRLKVDRAKEDFAKATRVLRRTAELASSVSDIAVAPISADEVRQVAAIFERAIEWREQAALADETNGIKPERRTKPGRPENEEGPLVEDLSAILDAAGLTKRAASRSIAGLLAALGGRTASPTQHLSVEKRLMRKAKKPRN